MRALHRHRAEPLLPWFEAENVSRQAVSAPAVDLALESFDFASRHKLADRMLDQRPGSGVGALAARSRPSPPRANRIVANRGVAKARRPRARN